MSKGVAVITGSSQGLGKAIASRLSHDGFAVVINDITAKQTQIDAVVKEIEAAGGKAVGIAADVTKRVEVEEMVDRATQQLGPLQVMVANAGLAHASGIFELNEEEVHRILDVNVIGVFNCFVVAGKKMVEQRQGGKIIAASSVAAFKSMALVSAYTASKWAVRGLTQVCISCPLEVSTRMAPSNDRLSQTFAVELGALSKDHAKTINVRPLSPAI